MLRLFLLTCRVAVFIAESLWIALRNNGKKVVAATFPGADGLEIEIPGLTDSPIVQPASDRTVDYTVPFGAFGGVFAKKYGREAIAVDPRGTSQICSDCGQEVKKNLAVRVHNCSCGLTLNRGYNAAINILNRATAGRAESQAQGEKTATLRRLSLVEQVLSMN